MPRQRLWVPKCPSKRIKPLLSIIFLFLLSSFFSFLWEQISFFPKMPQIHSCNCIAFLSTELRRKKVDKVKKHPQNVLRMFFSSTLWQINRAPSFGTDQKIDYDVKKGVLLNALKLLNIRYCSPPGHTHSHTHADRHMWTTSNGLLLFMCCGRQSSCQTLFYRALNV